MQVIATHFANNLHNLGTPIPAPPPSNYPLYMFISFMFFDSLSWNNRHVCQAIVIFFVHNFLHFSILHWMEHFFSSLLNLALDLLTCCQGNVSGQVLLVFLSIFISYTHSAFGNVFWRCLYCLIDRGPWVAEWKEMGPRLGPGSSLFGKSFGKILSSFDILNLMYLLHVYKSNPMFHVFFVVSATNGFVMIKVYLHCLQEVYLSMLLLLILLSISYLSCINFLCAPNAKYMCRCLEGTMVPYSHFKTFFIEIVNQPNV